MSQGEEGEEGRRDGGEELKVVGGKGGGGSRKEKARGGYIIGSYIILYSNILQYQTKKKQNYIT